MSKIKRAKQKPDEQKSELGNIQKFPTSQKNVMKLYDDYSSFASKAKYKEKHGKGLKILTSKQVLEKVAIVLAQVKAGNTSENLLNETRQIIYSLHRAK